MEFILLALATLGIHRIWNWEDVFSSVKKKIELFTFWPINKVAICPPCNAFWIAAGVTAFWYYVGYLPALVPFALFAVVRLFIAIHHWWGIVFGLTNNLAAKASLETVKASEKMGVVQKSAVEGLKPVECPTCGKGNKSTAVQNIVKEQERVLKYPKRVVILTTLSNFNPSYSVAQCVLDQARAIGMQNPEWLVQVWVMQTANEAGWEDMPANVELKKVIPSVAWKEDVEDDNIVKHLKDSVTRELMQLGNAEVITHDIMFISWYLNFAKAIHQIGAMAGFRWWHVCHSLPGGNGGPEWRTTVPPGKHTIVTVAEGYEEKFSAYYHGAQVIQVSNIRDPRTWGTMTPRLRRLVSALRLWEKDIVQIYPVCTTRMEAKGVHKIMRAFSILQESRKVMLLVCNPNAKPEIINAFRKRADSLGLKQDAFAFTSEVIPEAANTGLTADEVKALMYGYGNLFLFPTVSEADSLMLAEAQLTRQYIITNANVPTIADEGDGSVHWGTSTRDDSHLIADIAAQMALVGMTNGDSRRRVLGKRNLEGIGDRWGKILAGP